MSAGARDTSPGPLGARVEGGKVVFRAFVTGCEVCAVRLFDAEGGVRATHPMEALGDGYFEARLDGVGPGALYKLVVGERELPDPYARALPHGVHGPAMVLGDSMYSWRHEPVARPLSEHVLYEVHVGTFTAEGTYAAAAERLPDLVELGVTAVELMPISSFPGERGWGYDGVAHFAPFAPYGAPDDLRRFIDAAHGLGLAVILDAVYNHLGPSGNYLAAYSKEYFTHDVKTPWGDGLNFTHPVVRRFVIDNALFWLADFRFDGLRLDATHAIVDPSPRHVLRELADEAAKLSPPRLLIAEDERNDPSLVLETGLSALWADDFHHQVRVTLTGEKDGYYAAYQPGAAGVARTIERGWLYEGQRHAPLGAPRGAPADGLRAEQLVYTLQNHDQIGNRAVGDRLSSAIGVDAYCAVSALLLFLPMTPLLFMGQEWAASSPFLYFTDHEEELGRLVSAGRREEFKAFTDFADPAARARIPDPQAKTTFLRSRLRWDERTEGDHARVLSFYRACLSLRRDDPVLRASGREGLFAEARGEVLLVRRELGGARRWLIVNFDPGPVPLKGLLPDPTSLRRLLSSPAEMGDVLPPHGAVLLAEG